ncbi:unnamed protein product [Rotaria socialis]|uniref:HAT C-terminal dimerisation domain-containing protein n=2 Tax=Rotaria socialis TaxID=392032 RepID=A0A820GXK0_9BILA|nr:unnamed protein product [Rotaria socialis]CAF4282234.1 unnamed protein product [Rotaria socialis]
MGGLSYHKYRKELRATLTSVRAIAITVDIWTKKQTSFICLTGHAFNKKYESIPIVLGFRRLSGAHRANNLKNYIIYEMQQLDIEEKACAIVSDNGSDIKKAINDIKPGERFSCFAHDINLVVKNGLKIWEPIEKKKQITQTTTATTTTNASIYNYDSDDENMSEPDRADIPEELEDDTIDEKAENDESGDDGEEEENSTGSDNESGNGSDDDVSEYEDIIDIESEDDDEDDYQFTNQKEQPLIQPYQTQLLIYRLIHRVRACVINVRSTRAICDYVKTQGKSNEPPIKAGLATDFEIRWNTTFIMIDRFSNHRFIIDNINSQPFKVPDINSAQRMKLASKKFEFTNDDWSRLKDLQTVLKPFFKATKAISAKNYPTLAAAYSIKYALRYFLFNETSANESLWLKSLKLCLRRTLELYFDEKMEMHQKNTSLVAAFLEPNEYCRLRQRPIELQAAIVLLKIEMQKETLRITQNNVVVQSNVTNSRSRSINTNSTDAKQNNIDSLFSLCGISSSSDQTLPGKKVWSIDEEIGFYMSSINISKKIKFSHYWSDYEHRLPLMSGVVRRVSIIPASSVPCESTFSIAGYIRRKERCSLSANAIRYSLVLKDSHKLELLR